MGDTKLARLTRLFPPPGKIVIAPAQIDDAADAAFLQERLELASPGLHGARRFARHHPVEIVENVANCSGRGASHRMELPQSARQCASPNRPWSAAGAFPPSPRCLSWLCWPGRIGA